MEDRFEKPRSGFQSLNVTAKTSTRRDEFNRRERKERREEMALRESR